MSVLGVFTRRVRGFRVIDVTGLAIVLVLALSVYGFKTFAGRERSDIADIESQIHDEARQVLLLRAEIAHLESPDRLEKLATAWAGQSPVSAKQEVTPDGLAKLGAPPAAAPPASNAIPAANATLAATNAPDAEAGQ